MKRVRNLEEWAQKVLHPHGFWVLVKRMNEALAGFATIDITIGSKGNRTHSPDNSKYVNELIMATRQKGIKELAPCRKYTTLRTIEVVIHLRTA